MKEDEVSGVYSTHKRDRISIRILVEKREGKRPLGRPSRRWEVIRVNLREVGWGGVDWIHLAQDRVQ
jgi:hypothetical protein